MSTLFPDSMLNRQANQVYTQRIHGPITYLVFRLFQACLFIYMKENNVQILNLFSLVLCLKRTLIFLPVKGLKITMKFKLFCDSFQSNPSHIHLYILYQILVGELRLLYILKLIKSTQVCIKMFLGDRLQLLPKTLLITLKFYGAKWKMEWFWIKERKKKKKKKTKE